MSLTLEAAARKDRISGKGATMEHQHFACIAAIIAGASHHHINGMEQRKMADMFAHELARTNPRFDRRRFMHACGFAD